MLRSRRVKIWLRQGLLGALGIELVYLLAANLFLNAPLAHLVQRKPERFLVAWDSGWTVVPGIAHLRGIHLRGQSRTVQWQADIDSAKVAISLGPLITRRFLARRVTAQGLSFRLRKRLREGESRVPLAPPIRGLSNPPRMAPEELYPPPPPGRDPWVVRFDEIEVTAVREVWIDRYRFAANADPHARRFDLSGSHLSLDNVSRSASGEPMKSGWWSRIDLLDGVIHWTEPLGLDAEFRAQMRDSRPLIAILAEKKPLLDWIEPLLAVEDLSLSTRLRSTNCAILLHDATLTGDGLELQADLRFGEQRPQGYFFFKRGPLSAAVGLEDGASEWQLFGSRNWYEAHTVRQPKAGHECPGAASAP